MIEQGVIG